MTRVISRSRRFGGAGPLHANALGKLMQALGL